MNWILFRLVRTALNQAMAAALLSVTLVPTAWSWSDHASLVWPLLRSQPEQAPLAWSELSFLGGGASQLAARFSAVASRWIAPGPVAESPAQREPMTILPLLCALEPGDV